MNHFLSYTLPNLPFYIATKVMDAIKELEDNGYKATDVEVKSIPSPNIAGVSDVRSFEIKFEKLIPNGDFEWDANDDVAKYTLEVGIKDRYYRGCVKKQNGHMALVGDFFTSRSKSISHKGGLGTSHKPFVKKIASFVY